MSRFLDSNVNVGRQKIKVILVFIFVFFLSLLISNKSFRPVINGHINRSTLTSNIILATVLSGAFAILLLTQKHIKRIELCDEKKELKLIFQKSFRKEMVVTIAYKKVCYKTKDRKGNYQLLIKDDKNFDFILSEFDNDTLIEIEKQLREIGAREIV